MAYTNETTHYGFPLPLGTDLTVPMDYNESLEAADTALFEAATNASGAVATAGNALDVANAASTEAATATATANAATVTANAASTTANQAISEVADALSDAEDMICAYNEATATSTHAYEVDDYFIYNNVLYKCTVAIAIGDTIVPNTNCSATNVATELVTIEDSVKNIVGIADTLIVEAIQSGSFSVSAGGQQDFTIGYTSVSGYSAIGVLTFTTSSACTISGIYLNTPNSAVAGSVHNPTGDAQTVIVQCSILLVKTEML